MIEAIRRRLARTLYMKAWSGGLDYVRKHADHVIDAAGIELSADERAYLMSWIEARSDCAMRVLAPIYLRQLRLQADRPIYCFGCGNGGTATAYIRSFRHFGMTPPRLCLFDSFQGLPQEDPSCPPHPLWSPGTFQFSEPALRETLAQEEFSDYRIFPGFFADVCSGELARREGFGTGSIIDIDCDLYRSAYDALDFVFANGLAAPGTLIVFDDWGDTEPWIGGESRAFKEISQRYALRSAQLCSWGARPNMKKMFLILEPAGGVATI